MDKAKWINSQYIKNTPNPCLLKFIDIKDKKYSDDKLSMIIDICKERSNFKKELNGIAKIFFNNVICSDNSKYDENYKKVMTTFIFNIGIDWNSDSIKDKISEICTNNNIKLGKIMPGLRNAITGGIPGPDLMTTMFILGREETFNRIKTSL
jgi:glutamyl-tRNA synthetase